MIKNLFTDTRARNFCFSCRKKCNKPGTARVGFISKAQKYSRNNNWKHLDFFQKKYLVNKSHIAEKPKKRPLGSTESFKKNFFTNRKLQKIQGVPFDKIQNFSEKCRIVPKKNAKGGPFGLHYNFEA